MKITYDPSIDAAYIYFEENKLKRKVKKTYTCDPREVNGMINLDFNQNGELIGIEVLDAQTKLPKVVLEIAEKI